ncbi:MAG: amidohydrolase family protein [Lentisphaeria bacterium]|nr:amidohydrolase family protein [Lentisphaeria bacterium]
MKIIDFHAHYYPDKIVERALKAAIDFITPQTDGTRKGLIKSMQQNNIIYSVGLPIVTAVENTLSVNAWAAAENHDEICMLGSVHINDPNYDKTLEFIQKNNMRGIKLHPEYQNFVFNDPKMDRIFAKCVELDLFVIVHSGFDIMFKPPYKCTPAMLKNVKKRFPSLKLIGAHLGGMRDYENVEKELIGQPIYLDLSFMTEENIEFTLLEKLIKRHDPDYLLFGTDSPWCDQKRVIDLVNQFDISASDKEKIFYSNAAKLLKIQ